MKLNSVNQQNSQSFGTAFVSFNKLRLPELSPKAQKEVEQMTTTFIKDLDFFKWHETGLVVSTNHPTKWAAVSEGSNNVGLRLTETSEKEEKLVADFRKAFEDKGISTKIIPNTPENANQIKEASMKQLGQVENAISFQLFG